MYSSLANYTFGSPSTDPLDAATESISPLSALFPSDRTPRPSLTPSPAPRLVSSHPSQGAGFSAPFSSVSGAHSASDPEKSQDPTPSTDPIIAAVSKSHRAIVLPDNASQHTFGPFSRTHRVTAAYSIDGAAPSSSSSVATSRSSSRASMNTSEQFTSDDEFEEIHYYDGSSSPVTFARDDLPEFDHNIDPTISGPSTLHSSPFDARRGSLPMAIPGAIHPTDHLNARSREGSVATLRRPSQSWDDASVRRLSYSADEPSLIFPNSDPVSRPGRLSLEVQQQAKQQANEPDAYHGLDLQYIFSKRSEGSIRSFNSRLSFVQPGVPGARISSPHLGAIPLGLGSTSAFQDPFTRHIQKYDTAFNVTRFLWSFQREKADASGASSRRRHQALHRTDRSAKELPPPIQEMWRCGHVGRFKVDRMVVKPQSADPAKGAQQRIQVRHIPDPYLTGNITNGPHSVIHKHSRAIAFSIFRSHGLFYASRRSGPHGMGHSGLPMHMNLRSATMLALKKVQEQYTSTKTVRQLGPFQSGDISQGDKENKGKSKSKSASKSRSKEKIDKKHHRPNPTGSAESSTATSSGGSVTNSATQTVASVTQNTVPSFRLSPSTSHSTTLYNHDSVNHPVSTASLISPSTSDSANVAQSDTSSIPPIRHHRDHRDSIDSEDRPPTRTTHAEAFSTLDPNDIESLRAKQIRINADSGSTLERFFRVFRGNSKPEEHVLSSTQPRAFQPPWMITAGRDQQEENDRVLDDLNASFRDLGLVPANSHKPPKTGSRQKSKEGILDQIPDDCLYMLLPLWPGETDAVNAKTETDSTTSFFKDLKNRQYLLVHYVSPPEAVPSRDKRPEKKRAKHTHSSDSGVDVDSKGTFLPAFHVVARVVTYDELQLSGVRIPSDGLAISGPEWEAVTYAPPSPPWDVQMTNVIVCKCESRELGFDFLEEGLLQLGLCTREEVREDIREESLFEIPVLERDVREGKSILTPIGKAAVEMIWLGCLAVTSFGTI